MTDAESTLEKNFRRLLLAYPRWYRADRGEEMIATLLEASDAGQTRPTRRQRVSLVTGGLRCRMRVRGGKGAITLAIVTALLFGAIGGCAAAWLGWQFAAPLPEAGLDIAHDALPGQKPSAIVHSDALFSYDTAYLAGRGSNPAWLVEWLGGDDYVPGKDYLNYDSVTVEKPDRGPLDGATDRLRAAGWRITEHRVVSDEGGGTETVMARKDGLILQLDGEINPFKDLSHSLGGKSRVELLEVSIMRAQPGAVAPLVAAGIGLGALLGWLFAVRMIVLANLRNPGRRRAVAAGAIVAIALAGLPALMTVLGLGSVLMTDASTTPSAPWGALYFIGLRPLCLLAATAAVITVVVAHLPSRRTAAVPGTT